MVISHNLQAMNANRQLNLVTGSLAKKTEKLSSGYKINRAADDAAGLAISEKMRRQIRGLTKASENCQDGISMVQTAEGGLNEVHDMLQRMNELSIKASNGTLNDADREYVDSEVQALKSEINRVANSTTFNEIQLFPSDGSSIVTSEYELTQNADGTFSMRELATAYSVGSVTATDNATQLADYVKTLIPGTINDILAAYPSLNDSLEDLTIKVDLSYIDGPNGTLAYAGFSYYTQPSGVSPAPDSFHVKIDTADFTDSNGLDSPKGDRNDLLIATLKHELTHTLMQYTMTDAMVNDLPKWFKEGAAQVSGGGFSTGWTSGITNIIDDPSITDKEQAVSKYLKSTTVDKQPYGHGYLATAYAAQLASQAGTTVTATSQRDGLNKIFNEIKNNGSTLDQALKTLTGKSMAEIVNDINSADPLAVAFATELGKAVGHGAGSAVGAELNEGTQLMGTIPADGSVGGSAVSAGEVIIQAGTENDPNVQIELKLFSIGTKSLGIDEMDELTIGNANRAIDQIKNAIAVVSSIRSYYGAMQNRLEHTIKNLDNVVENTTAAESSIRDTDMATTMVQYSNLNILAQAGTAMLAQANQSNQNVLSLLQ